MQVRPVLDNRGQSTGEYRWDGHVANRALELIGKHLGMFTERPAESLPQDNRQVFNLVISTPEGKEMPIPASRGHGPYVR